MYNSIEWCNTLEQSLETMDIKKRNSMVEFDWLKVVVDPLQS